jgi:hypothetical protein
MSPHLLKPGMVFKRITAISQMNEWRMCLVPPVQDACDLEFYDVVYLSQSGRVATWSFFSIGIDTFVHVELLE